MLRRILIGLGALVAIVFALYVSVITFFYYSFTRLDDYPAFMTELKPSSHPQSYDQASLAFSKFVAKTFPIGSSAEDAVAKISAEGFKVSTSQPDSTGLIWKRAAGPCDERYSIIILMDAQRRISNISGELNPVCL